MPQIDGLRLADNVPCYAYVYHSEILFEHQRNALYRIWLRNKGASEASRGNAVSVWARSLSGQACQYCPAHCALELCVVPIPNVDSTETGSVCFFATASAIVALVAR